MCNFDARLCCDLPASRVMIRGAAESPLGLMMICLIGSESPKPRGIRMPNVAAPTELRSRMPPNRGGVEPSTRLGEPRACPRSNRESQKARRSRGRVDASGGKSGAYRRRRETPLSRRSEGGFDSGRAAICSPAARAAAESNAITKATAGICRIAPPPRTRSSTSISARLPAAILGIRPHGQKSSLRC